jgi:DNA-binding NarL/FixJ family response regulator
VLLVAVSDLMFQSRIVAAAESLGLKTQIADSESALSAAIGSASSVVIDLHDRAFDAVDVIGRAHAAGVRSMAFGRHTEPALLRAARDAGAAIVVPRSQLVEELPELLRRLMRDATN